MFQKHCAQTKNKSLRKQICPLTSISVLDLSADIDLWPLFDKNEVKVCKVNKTEVLCKQTAGELTTDIKMNELKT